MPINIDNLNPPERFYYPGTEDEWVEFVFPNDETMESINAQTVTRKVEHVYPQKKNGKPDRRRPAQRFEYEHVDPKREDMIAMASIHDWHLVTPTGEEIPCTDENKLKMIKGSVEFNVWMARCLESMGDRKEGLEKN